MSLFTTSICFCEAIGLTIHVRHVLVGQNYVHGFRPGLFQSLLSIRRDYHLVARPGECECHHLADGTRVINKQLKARKATDALLPRRTNPLQFCPNPSSRRCIKRESRRASAKIAAPLLATSRDARIAHRDCLSASLPAGRSLRLVRAWR